MNGINNAFTNKVGQTGTFSLKEMGGAQVRDVNIQKPTTPRVFGGGHNVNLTDQQKKGSIF